MPKTYIYDGGKIIQDCEIPSSRTVLGSNPGVKYSIDVREFLMADRNSVIQNVLRHDVKSFLQSMNSGHKNLSSCEFFQSRRHGSFDFKADVLSTFVGQTIKYESRGDNDPWLFPDETLAIKKGDCRDSAVLLASLLIASGISHYNVRVALGALVPDDKESESHDHAWVMYKDESARWIILEIFHKDYEKPDSQQAVKSHYEYQPMYLFNSEHLWTATSKQSNFGSDVKRNWGKLHPTFSGSVHHSLLADALKSDDPTVTMLREALLRRFSAYIGNLVDFIDDPGRVPYSPFDHFDNGYIQESLDKLQIRATGVQDQLNTSNNYSQIITDLGFVLHAVADFYAHTSYGHFTPLNANGELDPYDLMSFGTTDTCVTADYTSTGIELCSTASRFSINAELVTFADNNDVLGMWAGKLISGRYSQNHDSYDVEHPDLFEQNLIFPTDLLSDPKFKFRGGLPHHNEIAVDDSTRGSQHKLYQDDAAYQRQFTLRYNAAVRNLQEVFCDTCQISKNKLTGWQPMVA